MNKQFVQNFYLDFLKYAARLQLLKNRPTIIGITGSAGKSSAVLATYLVLHSKLHSKVHYTKKGNSETGIPYEILNIPVENYQGIKWLNPVFLGCWRLVTYWPTYKILVAELGIDAEKSPKNMSHHLEIVSPEAGALLNVSSVHGENFSGKDVVQAIANEKRKLLTSLPQHGLAVFSANHPQILNNDPKIQSQVKTFSSEPSQSADMKLDRYKISTKGTSYTFFYQHKLYTLTFSQQLHTQMAFGSFATALLIGEKYGVSIEDGIAALQRKYTLPPGRMSVFKGLKETTLIDSTYNSSPESTTSALEMCASIPTKARRIAILGDMRELGVDAESAHQLLADAAVKTMDFIIWVGPLTKKYSYDWLANKGVTNKKQLWFENAWKVVEKIDELTEQNDLILLKGSQNTILLEIVVEYLLANQSDATLLCRREKYWQDKRLELRKAQ